MVLAQTEKGKSSGALLPALMSESLAGALTGGALPPPKQA